MKRQAPLSLLALVVALPLLASALLAGASIRAVQLVLTVGRARGPMSIRLEREHR